MLFFTLTCRDGVEGSDLVNIKAYPSNHRLVSSLSSSRLVAVVSSSDLGGGGGGGGEGGGTRSRSGSASMIY